MRFCCAVSPTELIIIASVTAFASFAIGITGFGFGLITMSVYPNFMPVPESAALVAVLGLGIIVVNLYPIRTHIRFDILWPLLVSAVAGVPVGVLVLVRFSEVVLRIGLGSLILVTLLFDVLRPKHIERKPNYAVAVVAGVVSGAFGGAFSVSGPPVVLYLSAIIRHKYELKASLLAYFFAIAILRLPFLVAGGILSVQLFRIALIVLVPLAGGLAVGMIVFRRMNEKLVRTVVRVFLAVSAILLIIRT